MWQTPGGCEMDTVDLVILVGIQASGKTTFFRRHMENGYVHVSLDNWRGKDNVREKERLAIEAGLRSAAGGAGGNGVVVDNTNTTAATRRRYFDHARRFADETGRRVRVLAYFFDADLAGCLERNEQRPVDPPAGTPYYVPPVAIARFHQRLEPPTQSEGFGKIFRVRIVPAGRFEIEEINR